MVFADTHAIRPSPKAPEHAGNIGGESEHPQISLSPVTLLNLLPRVTRYMSFCGRFMLAIGAMGLGLIELLAGDFIGRWEPVPASIPLHHGLAWSSGLMLLVCGVGLVGRRAMHASALTLALFLLLWIAVLHAPLVTAAPFDLQTWLYLGEVMAIGCGALMLWAAPGHGRAAIAARLGFGLSLLTFGASHFADLKVTASAVPPYIPAHVAVAAITGVAHIAAGVALLSGRLHRLASALAAAMMSVFVLLVDLPAVITRPAHRGAWIALLAEGALVGAAWIVAAALRAGPGPFRDSAATTLRDIA